MFSGLSFWRDRVENGGDAEHDDVKKSGQMSKMTP